VGSPFFGLVARGRLCAPPLTRHEPFRILESGREIDDPDERCGDGSTLADLLEADDDPAVEVLARITEQETLGRLEPDEARLARLLLAGYDGVEAAAELGTDYQKLCRQRRKLRAKVAGRRHEKAPRACDGGARVKERTEIVVSTA
jgi:hypothetical protein